MTFIVNFQNDNLNFIEGLYNRHFAFYWVIWSLMTGTSLQLAPLVLMIIGGWMDDIYVCAHWKCEFSQLNLLHFQVM